jgi:hypothetical protein
MRPQSLNLAPQFLARALIVDCRQIIVEINYITGMQWKADWDMESETYRTMRKPAPAP